MRIAHRRRVATLLTSLLVLIGVGDAMASDDWPSRPVKVVVAFGPGSATDIVARLVAEELYAEFKQPFVVENRPGANGAIAGDIVAKAAPDGYTLTVATATVQSINPHLFAKLPYDPLKNFTLVARICTIPYLLAVDARLPVNTVREFIEWASKAKSLTYAYANGPGQIWGSLLSLRANLNAVGAPYKGSPQAMTDLAGGQLSYMFTDPAAGGPFLQSGKIRALALASDQRSTILPDLPTMREASGLEGFDLATWIGVAGPAGLPLVISEKINTAVNNALKKREIVKKLAALGADVMPATAAESQAYMARQLEAWGQRVRAAGIQPQ